MTFFSSLFSGKSTSGNFALVYDFVKLKSQSRLKKTQWANELTSSTCRTCSDRIECVRDSAEDFKFLMRVYRVRERLFYFILLLFFLYFLYFL